MGWYLQFTVPNQKLAHTPTAYPTPERFKFANTVNFWGYQWSELYLAAGGSNKLSSFHFFYW